MTSFFNAGNDTMMKLSGLMSVILSLLVASATAIYPDDLWERSTKLTTQEGFDAAVQEAIDNDRTLFVRWIASEG